MDAYVSHGRSQALLKQRNLLALLAAGLTVFVVVLFGVIATKDREVVLQPVLSRPMTISSSSVAPDYLEAVTRDTAYLILNRSPDGLNYWMDSILKLVDPSFYGIIKTQLVKTVKEQSNTDIAQSFTMTAMTVDTVKLRSEVSGEVRTFVGDKLISTEKKTFQFSWKYSGVSLSLTGFGAVIADPANPTKGRL
ncbi:type IV conjugative transfer system protein TraE [Sphingomonas sp. BIUV-7]|uniref:Type IV conjugative transfer system protein TraE n=1 Tax=Sphingomonas natans TaxID=3063330 RepID=A0ABT8Y8W1_9SPHN|nr:type IV conjugative transfer system protein TraE [Sphingomonas sp. BIUV-7]MDO6414417.1 type IV conjugative transfer system protein TraE [Sphingomonas sp. BIUV-7]